MSDLNVQIVREFFEFHLFHVLSNWQHEALPRITDFGSILFVEHASNPEPDNGEAPFLLPPGQLERVSRAVVEVRAWHADRFYPSVIESSPILGHVAFDSTREMAKTVFGSPEFATVLVISELPGSPEPRDRALEMLAELGMDHVLEFSAILSDMLERITPHGNYAPSQTLQTLRLIKRYRLVRQQQLELPFSMQDPLLAESPKVDAAEQPLLIQSGDGDGDPDEPDF